MKNLFIIATIAISSAAVAQPSNTDAYYIKTVGGKFACVNGDAVRLCDEDQKTAFVMEHTANGVVLKSVDGAYLVALAKTDTCENNSGEIGIVSSAEEGNAFEVVNTSIKSTQYKTYIRANLVTGVLDQTDAAQDWEKFSFEPATLLVAKTPVQPKPETPAQPAVVAPAQAGLSGDGALLATVGVIGAVTLVAMKLCPLSGMGRR